jgi:dethiobiotin synthetase
MIDLIKQLDAEVIVVVKHYLGSINHTLLSLDVLKHRNITIKAVIFNGDADSYSEDIIRNYAKCKTLAIPEFPTITKEVIAQQKVSI